MSTDSGAAVAASDGTRGLRIADSLREHFVFPCAGFAPIPDPLWAYAAANYGEPKHDKPSEIKEDSSCGHVWAVENIRFGTTWAAMPIFIDTLVPSQVHVYIPDQSQWPEECWDSLDASESVHIHGSRSRALAIAAHLRKGLGHWSASQDGFEQTYVELPLGSAIVLHEMKSDPKLLEFEIIPNTSDAASGRFLTKSELAGMWGRSELEMPPSVSYKDLKLIRYLESDVTLVSLKGQDGPTELLAFKGRRKPHTIYHELKILLQLPSLETIISPPRYLVTLESEYDQPLVCGFLTTFIEGGSLDVRLPQLRREGALTTEYQLRLAMDITSTLINVSDSPACFYSDLRPDQILVYKNTTGREWPVLLDFEQSRNLYNWTAPEMYNMEWIAEMGSPQYSRSDKVPQDVTKKYGSLLDRILEARGYETLPTQPRRYDNPALGWYWPWLTSTAAERESAMVYMLGKLLWCIFEGRGDADIVLGRSSPEEAEQRFPDFVRTPARMRRLITHCTAGAREWIDGPIKIYRREGVVYPLGMAGLGGEPEATACQTRDAIRAFWQDEMRKAEEFAEARIRWDVGRPADGDRQLLHYLDRPRLREVLAELEAFGLSRQQNRWSCGLL